MLEGKLEAQIVGPLCNPNFVTLYCGDMDYDNYCERCRPTWVLSHGILRGMVMCKVLRI